MKNRFNDIWYSPNCKPIEPIIFNGGKKKTLKGAGLWEDFKNKLSEGYDELKKRGSTVLTGTNYVGPFNALDAEYVKSHPPTDIIDEGAKIHDETYSKLAKLRDDGVLTKDEVNKQIRESDDTFLNNIKNNFDKNKWAGALGYLGIKGKTLAEDYLGLDRNKFVAQGHHLHHYLKIHKQLNKIKAGAKFNKTLLRSAVKNNYITEQYVKDYLASNNDHTELVNKMIGKRLKELKNLKGSGGYYKVPDVNGHREYVHLDEVPSSDFADKMNNQNARNNAWNDVKAHGYDPVLYKAFKSKYFNE